MQAYKHKHKHRKSTCEPGRTKQNSSANTLVISCPGSCAYDLYLRRIGEPAFTGSLEHAFLFNTICRITRTEEDWRIFLSVLEVNWVRTSRTRHSCKLSKWIIMRSLLHFCYDIWYFQLSDYFIVARARSLLSEGDRMKNDLKGF